MISVINQKRVNIARKYLRTNNCIIWFIQRGDKSLRAPVPIENIFITAVPLRLACHSSSIKNKRFAHLEQSFFRTFEFRSLAFVLTKLGEANYEEQKVT